jgi:hypothetical protein
MAKNLYNVTIPFAGAIEVGVIAESEEEAKNLAFEHATIDREFARNVLLDQGSIFTHMEVLEYEFYEKTGSGNVTYLHYNQLEIELEEENYEE